MAFNIKQIAAIARFLHIHKKLYVTSLGQCFIEESSAIESTRTKNTIIDDPDDYISLRLMTVDEVSPENLQRFAKDTKLFDKAFKDGVTEGGGAKVPRFRDKREELIPKRGAEKTLDNETDDQIAKALGLQTKAEQEEAKERKRKQRIADEAYQKARDEEAERLLKEDAVAKAKEDAKKSKEQEALEKLKGK